MRRTALWLCGLLVGLTVAPANARAQTDATLGAAIHDLARDVKKYLDTVGKGKVKVGQFPGRGEASLSSSGPLLQTALEAKLRAMGCEIVTKKGDYELSGEFSVWEEPDGRQFIQIQLELRDRQGAAHTFEGMVKVGGKNTATKYFVKNEADLAKLLGPSVYLPPEEPEKKRIEAVKVQVDHPSTVIQGTRILAGKGAPFSLEVLKAPPRPGGGPHQPDDYKVCDPEVKDGLAFVPIGRTEVFAVRIINDADYDVAVDLRIDGLSMFHASELRDKKTDLPLYRYVIIPKRKATVIRGWFVNLKQSDEFLVTEYARSEAGKIGQSANLGTITATFQAAWDPDKGPPADEPKNPGAFAQSGDATGRGDRITANFEVLNHQIGVFRGAVSVRYSK
jgi:hypothetical protein